MSDGKVAAIIAISLVILVLLLVSITEYSRYIHNQQVIECIKVNNGNTNNFCESILK